jgi:hypothetical protein
MQVVEDEAPVKGEYVPAGQAVQVVGAAAPANVLYVPAPQSVQVAFEAAPVADDQVPMGHSPQFVAPVEEENEPAGQGLTSTPCKHTVMAPTLSFIPKSFTPSSTCVAMAGCAMLLTTGPKRAGATSSPEAVAKDHTKGRPG